VNRKFRFIVSGPSTRFWTRLFTAGMVAVCLLSFTRHAHAYGPTQCPASRFGADLNCTAGDVSITGIRIIGDITSCTGGSSITADLELTVNFAVPARYDIGIFLSNDGGDPQLLAGAASCSVGILPNTSPFLDLDPNGGADTCGDGQNNLTGITYMSAVTVLCQSVAGGGGNLYVPFVVSWDNKASPAGLTCTSIAHPVPGTKSKCNAPTVAQGSVSVIVLPTITKTDGVTFVQNGDAVAYSVVITNTTGVSLSGAVFKDPAVTNINVTGVTCAGSGASCPAVTVAAMQGAGVTIPAMPAGGSVTFTINATITGNPPDILTNTATVTVSGETASASDTDTVVGTIAIIPSNLSKFGTASTLMTFNYTLYNFGAFPDTIGLSAVSNNGWTVTCPASIPLSAGGLSNFIVTVQIPAGTPNGTVDVTTITATSGSDPTKTAVATAVTTVDAPLTFRPNNNASGGKGSSVFHVHRVQNNTAGATGVNFATILAGACAGWTTGVYKADMITQIPPATVTLTPFGGFEEIVVKLTIPPGAATGSVCTATTTATAGGNAAVVVDVTTVKDLILYSNPGYTTERYIYPAGNAVYAMAYGTLAATNYHYVWIDPNGVTQRTSPSWPGGAPLPDTYTVPVPGPLGTWTVNVVRTAGSVLFKTVNFYVGPDHISASYSGANPVNTDSNVTINLALHDRNDNVPFDPFGNLVKGNPPTTKDPLLISVTISGAASIVGNTLSCLPLPACIPVGQTVTGRLNSITGTATITITDSTKEAVTITATTFNSAVYGSPVRDDPTAVTFVIRRMQILIWQEIVN
jgi:hypothetical protein